jgi:hypothetical protein
MPSKSEANTRNGRRGGIGTARKYRTVITGLVPVILNVKAQRVPNRYGGAVLVNLKTAKALGLVIPEALLPNHKSLHFAKSDVINADVYAVSWKSVRNANAIMEIPIASANISLP